MIRAGFSASSNAVYDSCEFISDEIVHSVTEQLVEAVPAHSAEDDSMVALLNYSVHPRISSSQIRRPDILKSYNSLTVVVQVQLGQ